MVICYFMIHRSLTETAFNAIREIEAGMLCLIMHEVAQIQSQKVSCEYSGMYQTKL